MSSSWSFLWSLLYSEYYDMHTTCNYSFSIQFLYRPSHEKRTQSLNKEHLHIKGKVCWWEWWFQGCWYLVSTDREEIQIPTKKKKFSVCWCRTLEIEKKVKSLVGMEELANSKINIKALLTSMKKSVNKKAINFWWLQSTQWYHLFQQSLATWMKWWRKDSRFWFFQEKEQRIHWDKVARSSSCDQANIQDGW